MVTIFFLWDRGDGKVVRYTRLFVTRYSMFNCFRVFLTVDSIFLSLKWLASRAS